jgi:hypothetical protein
MRKLIYTDDEHSSTVRHCRNQSKPQPYRHRAHHLVSQEMELDTMAEYVIKVNHAYKEDELPGWMQREVHDHDRRYECDGHVFVEGRWGGLVCKKCGR